ncbi:MAG: PEP-CTERM sorting domain-containing protein [Bryobacteraceae bacterium]|nr:PEP-CTERM sorting domain-containing protein [Bryobacteraceae bacterium]
MPEPATLALAGGGGLAAIGFRKRRRPAKAEKRSGSKVTKGERRQ